MIVLAVFGSAQISGLADSSSSRAISAFLPAMSKTPPHRFDLVGEGLELFLDAHGWVPVP
jgi:hypothetical protein